MNEIFKICLQSGILILVIIALRAAFRHKISARAMYAFWLIPLIRLLIPFSIQSPLSIMNIFTRPSTTANNVSSQTDHAAYSVPPSIQPLPEAAAPSIPVAAAENTGVVATPQLSTLDILLIIWLIGIAIALCYFTIINVRFLRTLMKQAVKISVLAYLPKRTSVYVSPAAISPCVWGIIRRRIVLPDQCQGDEQEKEYALMHEIAHIRQHDNLFSLLRIIVCAVYWFHPLVWLAARLSRHDCEMSCDERVTTGLSFDEKLAYGHVLVRLIAENRKFTKPYIANTATTMLGGNNMKQRICRIAGKHKTSKAVTIVLAICMSAFLLISCTSANDVPEPKQPENSPIRTADEDAPAVDTLTINAVDTPDNEPTQPAETLSEYTQIVKDFSGYLPTMSSLRGLPIRFALDNLETVTVSCDHGAFLSFKDVFKNGTKSVTLSGEETVSINDTPRLVWLPLNTAGTLENIQSAVVHIHAIDINKNRYHQTMRILLDDTYAIFDMPDADNVALSTPVFIQYKKGNTSTHLTPMDLYYANFARFAADRITNVQSVEKAALNMKDDDVKTWKQKYDWIELDYPYLGVFIGAGDSRLELTPYTKILMFLNGEFAESMLLYNDDLGYSVPIYLGKPSSIPTLAFDQTNQSTIKHEDVSITMYAFTHKIGDTDTIFTRVLIQNTGSKDYLLIDAPYITLNIARNGTPVADMIGEQFEYIGLAFLPGYTADLGLTSYEAKQSGTYTLSGQFGNFELPSLDIVVE